MGDIVVRECSDCKVVKDILLNINGHERVCPDCQKVKRRVYYAKVGNRCSKKYEKTKTGFLMRLYRNMLSRVSGVQKQKFHLYEGLEILQKEDFKEWANASEEFHALFDNWKEADYPRKLAPSVNRIDSSMGYAPPNMEWVTMSENSRRGAVSRWSNENTAN